MHRIAIDATDPYRVIRSGILAIIGPHVTAISMDARPSLVIDDDEMCIRDRLAGTRMATVVVACAMPAIFAFMFATNQAFSLFYRENPLGWAVLAAAVLMEVVGVAACRRITKFSY